MRIAAKQLQSRHMSNPWLQIPLADYEGHMDLPEVAQADLLANLFGVLLNRFSPDSIAVLGCSGGNGFDRIDPAVTSRIVGIDINPAYIARAAERFGKRLPGLQFHVADIEAEELTFEPVALLYAALVFEYVNAETVLAQVPRLLKPDGALCTVVQLPSASVPDISPSCFASLTQLSTKMQLVPPQQLCALAMGNGLREIESQILTLPSTKRFHLQVFMRA
jgi:SAM-dependent methyltransferase